MDYKKYLRMVEYVRKVCENPHNELPTLRYLVRRYKEKQSTILEAIEGDNHLMANVAIGTRDGYFELQQGDYTIEYMGGD